MFFRKRVSPVPGEVLEVTTAPAKSEKEILKEIKEAELQSKLEECRKVYEKDLTKAIEEDLKLKAKAQTVDLDISVKTYPAGIFLAIRNNIELPCAFIERISVSPPQYYSGRDGYKTKQMVDGSYLSKNAPEIVRSDYHSYVQRGDAGTHMATLEVVMSSGRKAQIFINPYACEAIHKRACEIWKEGK